MSLKSAFMSKKRAAEPMQSLDYCLDFQINPIQTLNHYILADESVGGTDSRKTFRNHMNLNSYFKKNNL